MKFATLTPGCHDCFYYDTELPVFDAKNVGPDQTPRSDLGLHYLPMSLYIGTLVVNELTLKIPRKTTSDNVICCIFLQTFQTYFCM